MAKRVRESKKFGIVLIILIFCSIYGILPATIEATDTYLPDVPWMPQVPPGTWEETMNCGQASSLIIFTYYNDARDTTDTSNDPSSIWQINYWLSYKFSDKRYMDPKGNGYYTDTSRHELPPLVKEFGGFQDSIRHVGWTIQDLKNELCSSHPVIIFVYTNMAITGGEEHWMVLIGMDDKNVIVNDPGKNVESGKGKKYPIDQFKKCWARHGNIAVTIHPPGTTQNEWKFDEDGNTEGWMAYNVELRYKEGKLEGLSVENGILQIDPVAQDPYIISPFLSINTEEINAVEIRMASKAPDGRGAIYFTTSKSPEWNEDKKVEFTVTNDGKYHTYYVHMAKNSEWKDTITALRIDPTNKGIINSDKDVVRFDYIKLESIPTIIAPTQASPANVGDYNNPSHIKNPPVKIKVGGTTPISSLTIADFSFKIGEKSAVASLIDTSIPGEYVFDVTPPKQDAAGKYDLEVTVTYRDSTFRDVEKEAVIYTTGNADVILVIDRSGSMRGQKIEDAKNSAKLFIDYMMSEDKAGVVSFASSAKYNYHLTTLTDAVKTAIKNAIDEIYASGGTSIRNGLRYAYNDLVDRGNPTHAWAMVLLSDGCGAYPYDVILDIKSKNIRVYSVGLGSDVDQDLMEHIASETGGKYYFSPTSSQLQDIYYSIVGEITGWGTIIKRGVTIFLHKIIKIPVWIDQTIKEAIFGISWGGSEVGLVLYKPDGSLIDPSVANKNSKLGVGVGVEWEGV